MGCMTFAGRSRIVCTQNRNKLAATEGKAIHEILDIPGLEPIAARTLNAYISALQSLFSWAVPNGHANSNIFEGMRVKLSKNNRDDERPAFTAEQLQTMLRHITDEKARIKPDHQWIALIGMFTGMRLNEIAQLDLADLQQDSAGYAINVTKEGGEHKSLKKPLVCAARAGSRTPAGARLRGLRGGTP